MQALTLIDPKDWKSETITYTAMEQVFSKIPTKPGIYTITTDAPKEVLQRFGVREDPGHYNLAKKVSASDGLPDEIKIIQQADKPYLVYSGHSYRLRQRIREHFKGSKGTGCLAIFQLESLRKFNWSFEYVDTSSLFKGQVEDSKLFRTYLEQQHRAHIGWPILCSQ